PPGPGRPAGAGGGGAGLLPQRGHLRGRRVPGEGAGRAPAGHGAAGLRGHLGDAAAVRDLRDGRLVLAGVAGGGRLLTLVPFQVCLGQRRAGDAIGAADLYTRFWDVRPSLSFPFLLRAAPDGGRFETGHLWFLVCLLGFSLVRLPGMAALRGPRGRRLVEGVAGWLDRPGGLLLPVLPLAAVEVALGRGGRARRAGGRRL